MTYTLGFVSGWEVSHPFFNSVFQAAAKDGCHVISILSGPVLHRARNELCAMFLRETAHPTLLMVDSDIEFTTDDTAAIMVHPEPVVSGIYPDNKGNPVTDGCGFLRIDRHVIEALMPHPFNPIKTQNDEVTGEDVGFRFHAQQAGYPIVVDEAISVGHLKPRVMRLEPPSIAEMAEKAIRESMLA